MVPGDSSPALAMALPRATTSWIPSSNVRAPLATKRGVLAQAVPGAGGGGEAQPFNGVEHDEAEHRGRQLGVLGAGELLDRRLQQEVRQVPSGRFRRFLDELPRGVVDPGFAHAGSLRTLSWEGENQHLLRRLRSSAGRRANSVARGHCPRPHLAGGIPTSGTTRRPGRGAQGPWHACRRRIAGTTGSVPTRRICPGGRGPASEWGSRRARYRASVTPARTQSSSRAWTDSDSMIPASGPARTSRPDGTPRSRMAATNTVPKPWSRSNPIGPNVRLITGPVL